MQARQCVGQRNDASRLGSAVGLPGSELSCTRPELGAAALAPSFGNPDRTFVVGSLEFMREGDPPIRAMQEIESVLDERLPAGRTLRRSLRPLLFHSPHPIRSAEYSKVSLRIQVVNIGYEALVRLHERE